ncbi:sigma-70 family RNA polymerase sigma factor [Spirillospora sp. NPDC052269]
MTAASELIVRCRAGDAEAFRELVEPFRRELMVHCYRFLGSMHDAEDALQETLFDAWQGFGAFEARSSVRTRLYRVATNRCLKVLRSARRRPRTAAPGEDAAGFELPEPSAHGEVVWLEPYPDVLLEGLSDTAPGPEARYESRQAISLAFVTAVQLLPPRQRAVLILRDVLGYRADDVRLTMPPVPAEYLGCEAVARFHSAVFSQITRYRLVATRANGQPAFGVYLLDRRTPAWHGTGLMVLTLAADRITALTCFDSSHLSRFGLPRTLPFEH